MIEGESGWLLLLAAAFLLGACAAPSPTTPSPSPPSGPVLIAVGTVQDGGLPHTACNHRACEQAAADPSKRRAVASLGLAIPESSGLYLFDATPDITDQLRRLRPYRELPDSRVDRRPLDGIFLTHAHIGHYLGLAHLGYEVVHAESIPVWCTPRMAEFLSSNGPWDQLVRLGNIELRPLPPGQHVDLDGGVRVTAIAVPHRDEYADTIGFLIEGPERRVLYVPDTDAWRAWDPPIEERVADVDVAIVDGTFFSTDELPGRSVEQIGHPLIEDSLERLAAKVRDGHTVIFTHLNHSNPALDADGEARRRIDEGGFAVLAEDQRIPL